MEIDKLFGLPAHPLLVHVPVVLIPMAGLIALAMAIRPVWFVKHGWGLCVITGIGALGAIMAAGSGEQLEHMVGRNALIEDHAQAGELARTISIIFFVVVTALKVYQVRTAKQAARSAVTDTSPVKQAAWVGIVTSLLLGVSGIAGTVAVAVAGHDGAKASWQERVDQSGQAPDGQAPADQHDDDD
ncbi:MAG: DUF2231 domain-containing protein [Ilumatobacteraceae bacterium]